MAQSELTQVREELVKIGEKLADLTAARQGTNLPPQDYNKLVVDLHAGVMARLDGLEHSVAAVHDNTAGARDDKETIEWLDDELEYQQGKVDAIREAKRENEISRNHNNYTDSREFTPFAAMRDVYNKEIRGFPRNLHDLRALQYHQLSLFLQDVGLPISGDHFTRLFRLADFIGVGHKLFTLALKPIPR